MKKNMNVNNLGLAIAVCAALVSLNGANAKDKNQNNCDLSVPTSLSAVKATVWDESYLSTESNKLRAEALCADKITEIAKGDPIVTSHLSCSPPRDMHFNYRAEVDVIESTPLTINQSIQAKCERISACILNAKSTLEIEKLEQDAQAIKCQ